ncbi:aldo/keto reductase [Rubripirellula amarantea]|nr:aldo/keto reductase [Rubripirellula amarantea]
METTARTRLSLPPLVFGSGCLGNMLVASSDETKRDIVQSWVASMKAPIVIDSAGKYGAGLALEVIGRELQNAGVDPADVIISNKLGWRRTPLTGSEPTFEPGVWKDLKHDAAQDISGQGIRRCWEEGNELLGRYQTSLLSVHDPDEYLAAARNKEERAKRFADVLEAYEVLAEIRDEHDLDGVGIGCKDWRVVQELNEHVAFDWVMIANSLTIMSHPSELLRFLASLKDNGVAVVNSAVLHGGFLVGGDFCDYKPIDPSNPDHAAKLEWRSRFSSICNEHQVNLFQAAVAFATAHDAITSIALSSSEPRRTPSMVDAVHAKLPREFWLSLIAEELIRDEPSIIGKLLA